MKLPIPLKRVLLISFSCLYGAGALYWISHKFLRYAGPFGDEPHLLERLSGPVHLVAALLFIFVVGMIWANHQGPALKLNRNRFSGWSLFALLVGLGGSGIAILYGSEAVVNGAEWVHPYIGLSLLPLIAVHWKFRLKGKRKRK